LSLGRRNYTFYPTTVVVLQFNDNQDPRLIGFMIPESKTPGTISLARYFSVAEHLPAFTGIQISNRMIRATDDQHLAVIMTLRPIPGTAKLNM
jgi:hypothetical protein